MAKQPEVVHDVPAAEDAAPVIVPAKNIDEAIVQVYAAVGYVQKKKHGDGLRYNFASEADLIGALRGPMTAAGIYMRVLSYLDVQRVVGSSGGREPKPMNITTLRAVVRFTHAPSGTFVDVEALGEGSDSSDKSGNKAQTCAFKYSLRQLFCIETGDDPDQDQDKTHSNGQPQAPQRNSWDNRPAPAPQAQTARTAQPANASDALDAAKRKTRQAIDQMGPEAQERHADLLRVLDNLTRDDFAPIYRQIQDELANFTA